MELRDIVKSINKHKQGLFISCILGIALGIIYHSIPKSYYTTGSLYITRKTDPRIKTYFDYEGYYAQQAAESFTENVVSVLESVDIHGKTISSMNIQVTKMNLLKIKRDINVKKTSSQIITITVKGKTPEQSYYTWNKLIDISSKKLMEINLYNGDPYLKISKIDEPITTQLYFPLYVCIGVGLSMFIFVYFTFVVTKNYINNKERN